MPKASEAVVTEDNAPKFSGYVKESTDRRLELSFYALKISTESPTNLLFGTGLGSAGTEMLERFESQGHKKEIVQNQYLETLLEVGLLGVASIILSLATFIKLENLKFNPDIIALLLALSFQLLFFSGLPNALHVYLLPVIYLMYDKNSFSRVRK